jgi:two-component system sensor histidine kinase SenX3
VTGRHKTVAFFIVLGSLLVAVAIALNVSWIVLHARQVVPLVLGIIFFAVIIAGLVVYTVFLVREIRRNEQQNSFLNAVTHELKTPIASIRLYLETLQSREIPEVQRREFYAVMLADADRLLHTVEQVLRAGIAGQKNAGQQDYVVLAPLVQECCQLSRTRHHLSEEQLSCEVKPAAMDAAVIADPQDVRTAVLNLLDNAVKYSRDKVQVRATLDSPSGSETTIRVDDNGIGIPRKQLKLIFNRFYRVPGRHMMQVKGTGLGLYIVRAMAQRTGGRVFAESAGEGKGSTFVLSMPRAWR